MDMERALVLDTVRVTEQAAIAASRVAGKGDSDLVDQAGTDAMRRVLNELDIDGEIVIGEGERDEAPMLFIGEKVGRGGEGAWKIDIAVDPVEGTGITARMVSNSVAVIALAEKGGLFQAPDTYMEKLIVGPPAVGKVDLTWPVAANLSAVAQSLDRAVEDLTIVILDRPRHENLLKQVREAGARVKLIGDGDVIAALAAGGARDQRPRGHGHWGARPRACSPPPRSSVWAARFRGASSRATIPRGRGSRRWARAPSAFTARKT